MPAVASTRATSGAAGPGTNYRSALTLLASLFFMWGFITVINGTLLPHLRSVFELSYFQASLIESVWFIAYFFASIPSATLRSAAVGRSASRSSAVSSCCVAGGRSLV